MGHTVVVFTDRSGWLMDGDALYVLAGPLAWRSTEPGRFMRPDQDRDWWNALTPGPEWVRLDMDEMAELVQLLHTKQVHYVCVKGVAQDCQVAAVGDCMISAPTPSP